MVVHSAARIAVICGGVRADGLQAQRGLPVGGVDVYPFPFDGYHAHGHGNAVAQGVAHEVGLLAHKYIVRVAKDRLLRQAAL